jgi:hypothetical protein
MTKEWVCDSINRFITAMFLLVQTQDIDERVLRFPSDSNVFLSVSKSLRFDGLVWFMVFNVTFNNISELFGEPGENLDDLSPVTNKL